MSNPAGTGAVRSIVLVVALLAAPDGRAAEKGKDALPPADEPTAWSCTVETLLSEQRCVYEAQEIPATDPGRQGDENVKRAASLAPRGCAAVAKLRGAEAPDKELQAKCEKEFAAAAQACTLDGRQPLLDVGGRFPEAARTCYDALQEILRRTRQTALLAVSCCRCLAARRCAVAVEQCQREIASLGPGPQLRECLAGGCGDECGHVLPPGGREPAPAEPAPAKTTGPFWY